MELFDQGYNYQQIAKKLHIKSLPSLRHSVEKEGSKKESRKIYWGSQGNVGQGTTEEETDAFGGIEKKGGREG